MMARTAMPCTESATSSHYMAHVEDFQLYVVTSKTTYIKLHNTEVPLTHRQPHDRPQHSSGVDQQQMQHIHQQGPTPL
jgi:hypothetical protein